MSKQLAPIHEGLYKKIILFENIEKLIVSKTDRKEGHKILTQRFGDYLPPGNLSDVIDHNNIHGWLQEVINRTESRQASLVFALMNADLKLLELVKKAYYEIGLETGEYFHAEDPMKLYTNITTVLLDGMPCDRVNTIIENDETSIQWKTENCVHEDNWSKQGLDVELYYQFRTEFIKGFIKGNKEKYLYKFSKEYKLHELKKI